MPPRLLAFGWYREKICNLVDTASARWRCHFPVLRIGTKPQNYSRLHFDRWGGQSFADEWRCNQGVSSTGCCRTHKRAPWYRPGGQRPGAEISDPRINRWYHRPYGWDRRNMGKLKYSNFAIQCYFNIFQAAITLIGEHQKQCSECQFENREGAKFCNIWGHKFAFVNGWSWQDSRGAFIPVLPY